MKKFPAALPREHVEALDEIAKAMGESRNSVLKRAVLAFLAKDNSKNPTVEELERWEQDNG